MREVGTTGRSGTKTVAGALLIAIGCSVPLSGCGLVDPSFAVGDCVRIEQRALDADLKSADCADAVGSFNLEERVYRVDSIIDDTDGGCPELQGFFPVEFIHEPDGVTYCLVQQS